MSELFDIHQSLFKNAFSKALPYKEYLATATPAQAERWSSSYQQVSLPPPLVERSKLFKRKLNLLMLSGTWCGDCARQCPAVVRIAEATSLIDLRFIDNQADSLLRDELRVHGASRVPVLVGLSEDFFEVGRFGDRPLAAYQRKVERETGASCGVSFGSDPADEILADLSQWFEIIERWQALLRTSSLLRGRYED